MIQHQLANGDRVPALGLGTWKSAPGEVGATVRTAVRLGYRHIDCAPVYANEAEIGAVLRDVLGGEVSRDDLWITSKLWNNAHEPERVRPALEKTLADLQLDRLDLYLMHWPVAVRADVLIPETSDDFLSPEQVPLTATWEAMEECVDAGLCRHIGVSNCSAPKIESLIEHGRIPPAMNQVEMHPYLPQDALLDWCIAAGVAVTAYSPLGSPDRPRSMKKEGEPSLLDHPVIADVAKGLGVTPGQVLVAWAIQRNTLVIPKSVNEQRLADNLAAAELELSAEDMARIAELEGPYRYVDGNFWAKPGSPYTVAWLWDE